MELTSWPWVTAILIGLFTFVVILIKLKWSRRSRKEPPGPWGLPVFGYLPFLGRKMNLTINKLAKRYGEVFQLKMGSRKVVVISGQKAIREALLDSGSTFAGKPDFYSYAVTNAFGFEDFTPSYRAMKKITMKGINEFVTLRRTELQHVAQNAAKMFVQEVKTVGDKPMDPLPLVFRVSCTIIGYICFGKCFNAYDEDVTTILNLGSEFGNFVIFGVICDFLPWAKFLLRKKLTQFEQAIKKMEECYERIANRQSKEGSDDNTFGRIFDTPREDATLGEVELNTEAVKTQWRKLFGAGFGPVSLTMRFELMMMALYPDVQLKVQDELDRVVGKSRYPEFEDKKDLPFTMATVTEINRYFSMSALGIMSSTTCDTDFRGYSFAKGTPVMFNFYSVNRGDDVFEEADKFKPERFLNKDGSFNTAKASMVITFGLGQRRCGGEQLARQEIFLFFATILQLCIIEQSPAHPLNVDDYIMTLGIVHNPCQMVFHPRIEELITV